MTSDWRAGAVAVLRSLTWGATVLGTALLVFSLLRLPIVRGAASVFAGKEPELAGAWRLMLHEVERGRTYTSFEVWALLQAHVLLEFCVATSVAFAFAAGCFFTARRLSKEGRKAAPLG